MTLIVIYVKWLFVSFVIFKSVLNNAMELIENLDSLRVIRIGRLKHKRVRLSELTSTWLKYPVLTFLLPT